MTAPRDALLEAHPRLTLARWCGIVFVFSFLFMAVLPAGVFVYRGVPSGGENIHVARSLAETGRFADPFASMKTGTTAHVAPVYPFLYSLVLRAFGEGYAAIMILWGCNLAFLALQMALLPWVSCRLRLGVLSGIVAAALGTISQYTQVDTHWECFLAGAGLMLSFMATESCLGDALGIHPRLLDAKVLWAGILWGLLILTNPVTVVLLIAWPAAWIIRRMRNPWMNLLVRWALVAGIAAMIVSPWILRNYERFGAPIFVRDNLGLELAVSNNDCAMPTLRGNISSGCHARMHPNANPLIAAQVAAEGEYRFNQEKMRDALDWIGNHRADFLKLSASRFRQFWLPDLDGWWGIIPVVVWIITFLSFAGLGVMGRKNAPAAWSMAVTWILFPLIYYVVQAEPRYRYPIYWTSLLAAGCALVEVLGRLKDAAGKDKGRFMVRRFWIV